MTEFKGLEGCSQAYILPTDSKRLLCFLRFRARIVSPVPKALQYRSSYRNALGPVSGYKWRAATTALLRQPRDAGKTVFWEVSEAQTANSREVSTKSSSWTRTSSLSNSTR